MSGAVMDCRQDQNLHPQRKETSGRHSPGYCLQNHQSRQQNTHLQHSKAMNNKFLSDTFVAGDVPENSHDKNTNRTESRRASSTKYSCSWDPRSRTSHTTVRKPLELPVPKFEVDANYVGEIHREDNSNEVPNSKTLDLDTRIDFLIKTKALAGMHPIFSELNESDESNYDSDEPFTNNLKAKNRLAKRHKPSPPEDTVSFVGRFDDPERPLSRPPSPFLSRATYLFWFNKAIELKQQAKEQEQALLEKATKKLLCEHLSPVKINEVEKPNSETNKPLLDTLLHEVSKEFKEAVKQEFINEVLVNSALSAFEKWWEKQRHFELEQKHSDNNVDSNLALNDHKQGDINISGKDNVRCLSKKDCSKSYGSTSPKEPCTSKKEKRNKYDSKKSRKASILKNENSLIVQKSKEVQKSYSRKEDLSSAGSKERYVLNKAHRKDSSDFQMSNEPVTESNIIRNVDLDCDHTIQIPSGEDLKTDLNNDVHKNPSGSVNLEQLNYSGSSVHSKLGDCANVLLLSPPINDDTNKDISESVKDVLNFLISKIDEDTFQGESNKRSPQEEFLKKEECSNVITFNTTSNETSKIASETDLPEQSELNNSENKSNESDITLSSSKFDISAMSSDCLLIKKPENSDCL